MPSIYIVLLSGVFVGTASGLIGSFLVLRRMSLISDALSHVALPGIALGILFHFAPLWGGIFFLFIGITLIWFIETKTKLATESITGVIFVTALAVGALLMPESELLEAFFGNVENLTLKDTIIQSLIALAVIVFTTANIKTFSLFSIAPDLSASLKISNKKIAFLMLLLIALTISIGISFVGVLLMSALIIIPPAASKNIARSLKQFLAASAVFSVTSLLGGIIINHFYPAIQTGVITVLISFFFFIVSFLFRNKRRNTQKPQL